MKKKALKNTILVSLCGLMWAVPVRAEEVFIDCSVPNEQCKALYATQESFMPGALNQVAGNPETAVMTQIARDSTMPLAVSQPYNPKPEKLVPPPEDPNQQPSFEAYNYTRTQTEYIDIPLANNNDFTKVTVGNQNALVAPPYDPQPPKKEILIKDTPNGSIITQTETSTHQDDDGTIIEVSRVKETAISPKYVNMPSITEAQRNARIKFGTTTHDWQAPKGETLRALLMEWGEKSGWTIVWQLDRDYVLEAGVVFRGTFTDVASAILRTFARANPAPVGTFYKGNRVLLVNTQEDDNAR